VTIASLQLHRPCLIEPPVLAERAFVAAPDAVFGAADAEIEGDLLAAAAAKLAAWQSAR